MIVCRRCTTRFDDDTQAHCSNCGADLTGSDGLRLSGALAKDWSPADAARPVERSVPPLPTPAERIVPPASPTPGRTGDSVPPPPTPIGEVRETFRPTDEAGAPSARRRGRRPGEHDDDEPEPLSYESAASESAPSTDQRDVVPPPTPAPAPSVPVISSIPDRPRAPEPAVSRAPAEVGGGARTPDQDAVRVPAATGVTLADGEVGCPTCRRANDALKRFCRFCGSTLPAYGIEPPRGADELGPEPWIRRLLGTTRKDGRDARTFAQRARDSGQRRLKYRAKYTLKSRLRAMGFVCGGLTGLIIMLGPVRSRAREFVNPPDPIPVEGVIEDGTPSIDATKFGPELAYDTDPKTAFVMPWVGDPSAGEGGILDSGGGVSSTIAEAEQPATTASVSFIVRLPAGRPARKLVFETGFPNADLDGGSLYLRPKTLTLEGDDGETQLIELEDHEGRQRVPIELTGNPTTIRVTITTVHERDWATYDSVAIAEVAVIR